MISWKKTELRKALQLMIKMPKIDGTSKSAVKVKSSI